ncbi:hypothetical protein EW093_04790 [Thiospirochaeta perfilievii]|uniref:Peptidase M30 n=1 Tax=Thiospirochaeta perfilievii TaxID=252967 RepID=A0A5C1QB71_9SPIO|nr:hypothetical protein [Thiospirochaeta perfilievii]QEN04046.1 hypothetical protein EW093_04790 [Thiospirochaeta perfilievii]
MDIKKSFPIIINLIILLLTSSCFLGNNSDVLVVKTITVNSSLLPKSDSSNAYLLLTNPTSRNILIPEVTINSQSRSLITTRNSYPYPITPTTTLPRRLDKPPRTRENSIDISNRTRDINPQDSYSQGDLESFFVLVGSEVDENNNSVMTYSNTTFKLVSLTNKINNTTINLHIWVDVKDLDILSIDAVEFLKSNFSGIYNDMTNLYGDYWGEHNYENLIEKDNSDFHILLMDIGYDKNIDKDNRGVIYGYFDSYDTYIDKEGSNKALNVVLDSYLLFNRADSSKGWSEESIETIYGLSTFIHEFQHLIHFYQKRIKNKITLTSTNDETYVNEMFSMIAEDILAYNYLIASDESDTYFFPPDLQRIPIYNQDWIEHSTLNWNYDISSYSRAYVVGAYLIRNFDSFIKEYFTTGTLGINGLLEAINKNSTFNIDRTTLLQNLGLAILYSRETNTSRPQQLNSNSFLEYSNFNLIQLDFFSNYIPSFKPLDVAQIKDIANSNGINFYKESNIYINLGEISSSDTIKIEFANDGSGIEYRLVYY